jgi:two-component system response regulator NreC
VLARISHGWTSRQIAEALGISIRTVNTHRENLARKVGTSSPARLTRYAITSRIDTVD